MNLEVAQRTMKAVYARRDIQWTPADERMVAQVREFAPGVER